MDFLEHRHFERSHIEQSIYSRFAEQVAQFSYRPAIWTPARQWTYEDLSCRVDAIASVLLRRLGEGEGRVALIFDHDAPMIAGMLAAMRAGKAYVPLDPGYPEQRLQMMLEDSAAEALLIEAKHRDLANRLGGGRLPIVVESEAHHSAGILFPSVDPHAMAYILYTSGSTGRPKGVVQNNRNVLHFIRAYTNGLRLAPADRMTLLSSYSFDASVMGIFGGILNGACVCPRSVRDGRFDELGTWIRRAGISIYHSTPTVYREFLAASDASERFDSVRRVVLGGESVVRRDVELFKQFFEPGAILVNGLGPTESTVTLQNFIDHGTEIKTNIVPVGRPVCDTRIVLYDEAGEESDREGEMTFVSEHVALGYWKRPDLNKCSFGKYSGVPGLRWYRSGDLARWREDGNLEFLGRKDSQIKIHGVRIELGDVEAALQQHPSVAEAVAIGQISPGSELPRLIAYVRRRPGADLDDARHSEQIREGVRALLPSTMVPNVIVFLDAFPKTPTGKIDRLALPEPREIRCLPERAGGAPYVAPSSEVEINLVKLWQEVLGIEKVSVTDDFQSLGGDSLTALRLLWRMKAFGISYDVGRGILQGKTIRQIAHPEITSQGVVSIAGEARVNLLVNIVRGMLLAIVIAGHSLPSLVRRLPEFASWQQPLDIIFNIATPGFAFLFGLTMGKVYYPKYEKDAAQTRLMLRPSIQILWASIVVFSIPLLMSGVPIGTVLRWIMFHNVLLYYALAFSTVALWFRVISRFKPEYVGCAFLMVIFYCSYKALLLWFGPYDRDEGSLIIGLLITKFNYFNMSFGVMGGCAAGIFLAKNVGDELPVLSRRFALAGMAGVIAGIGFFYFQAGTLRSLGADEEDMGLWRWMLYSGLVLVMGGGLTAALARLEKWPLALLRGAHVVAAFGQCTFPIFLMHIILWPLKPVLNRLSIPDSIGYALVLTTFTAFTAWCVSSLYRLHYAGSYRES